ncbi:MAG: hypothetical protein GYB67_01780 [Chloroflexi bacterium]|nr:hypothetical protein [Chloroflexota bacterium]
MGEHDADMLSQVQNYRNVVLRYEALDEQIDRLLMAHNGNSDQLSAAERAEYRQLARQRDELFNEMRFMEQVLSLGEDGWETPLDHDESRA